MQQLVSLVVFLGKLHLWWLARPLGTLCTHLYYYQAEWKYGDLPTAATKGALVLRALGAEWLSVDLNRATVSLDAREHGHTLLGEDSAAWKGARQGG